MSKEKSTPSPSSPTPAQPTPQPVSPTAEQSPSSQPTQTQPKKSFPWLIVILIVGVLLICCTACAVIAGLAMWSSTENTSSSDSDQEEEYNWEEYWNDLEDPIPVDEEDQNPDVPDQEAETTTFTGNYVTAELPEGWTIVEYVDGDGSNMLVDQPYTGLTGLRIFTPSSAEAFFLTAVDGIGGTDACSQYYQFPDDNPSYLTEIQTLSGEVGVTPSIVSITAGEYTEFDFLSITVRRVGSDLYKDRTPGNQYFEAACGINELMEIPSLTFNGGGYESHTYKETISNALSADEFLTLDAILTSMAGI